MKRITFYTELAYVIGLVVLCLGTALMERADLGMSMVVAPAYILHLKVSEYAPFFSFGMAEYVFQGVLLFVLAAVLRRFRASYFFSFVTAFLYGIILDGVMALVALIPDFGIIMQIVFYIIGMLLCSLGVSLLFKTYISPEVYELFVKEIASAFHLPIHRVKTVYDITSCLFGVILSFCFFGFLHFEGIKLGTVICALLNGTLIGLCSRVLDALFSFSDGLPFRPYFEEKREDT